MHAHPCSAVAAKVSISASCCSRAPMYTLSQHPHPESPHPESPPRHPPTSSPYVTPLRHLLLCAPPVVPPSTSKPPPCMASCSMPHAMSCHGSGPTHLALRPHARGHACAGPQTCMRRRLHLPRALVSPSASAAAACSMHTGATLYASAAASLGPTGASAARCAAAAEMLP